MNRTIWKFELEITDEQWIDIPAFGTPISVGLDPNGNLCFWALVYPTNGNETRHVMIVGTGNPVPADATSKNFIGSVKDGPFVWHVFIS